MKIKAPLRTCALGMLLALTAGHTVSATTLFDLISLNQSITVGTLQFSNFSYLNTGDMPASAGVNVAAYVDPVTGDGGLKFQGAFLDFPGGGGSDALIDFTVTELDANKLVTGAALGGNPNIVPLTPGASGTASITETFLPTDPSLTLSIYASTINGVPGPSKLTDSGTFAVGHPTIFVQKDVLTFNGDLSGSSIPMISFITQTFHETSTNIPEPATIVLLGTGVVGLGLRQWRRRRS
jgi:hypothetical protein